MSFQYKIGGGTRLKIYKAVAMELPVVSNTFGAESLPVLDGEKYLCAITRRNLPKLVFDY